MISWSFKYNLQDISFFSHYLHLTIDMIYPVYCVKLMLYKFDDENSVSHYASWECRCVVRPWAFHSCRLILLFSNLPSKFAEWNACMPGNEQLEQLVWLLSQSDSESPPTMATGGGGGGGKPAPIPRGGKPGIGPKPHLQHGAHSQLGGRSMATLAADAAASVAQSHAHRGQGQMNEARAKTVLKEAVDAVVNSFAKHTHGYGRGESPLVLMTWPFF